MSRIKLLNNNYFNTEDIKHRDNANQLITLKDFLNNNGFRFFSRRAVQNTTGEKYYLLGTFPPKNNNGNAGFLHITGVLGGFYAVNKAVIDVFVANMGTNLFLGNYFGNATAFNYAKIKVYDNGDNTISVYYCEANNTYIGGCSFEISGMGLTSFPCSNSNTVTPSGKLIWESSSDTLTQRTDFKQMSI